MIFKKTMFLALLCVGYGSVSISRDFPRGNDPEPKQYGVPFSGVADPKDVVLYEVNIRAFSKTGDFQGVIDNLDHIKSLGVNTIWLMPIHPVGQERSAGGMGSPYAVRNYTEVNPEFGDLAKFRELVQKAHDRNMSVIIDWVANHTSWDNPWLKNKGWYAQDSIGNIIIPPGTNWQDVAELNYDNEEMRAAMIHALKYWVLDANVDGFRCDAVDFIPSDFWMEAIKALNAIPNRKLILLAEGGKVDNFTAGFQMNYAWDFYHNMKEVYKNGRTAASIFTTHQAEYNAIPTGKIKLRYTTNHDESAWEATPVEVFGGTKGALSASVITLFTSAAPLLYSSQEVGQSEKLPFFTREPINWNANAELTATYAKLFSIYNSNPAFRDGSLFSYADQDVAMFTRQLNSQECLVIVNVRNRKIIRELPEALRDSKWKDLVAGSSFRTKSSISLEPFEFLVLKR